MTSELRVPRDAMLMYLNAGDRGVDFSAFRLDTPTKVHQAKEAGCRFVIRYSAGAANVGPSGFLRKKLITPTEFRQLLTDGFDVIANSEWSKTRITEGASAGAADGAADLTLWKSCGLNQGSSIYVSWDADPAPSKYAAVVDYLHAYQLALGSHYFADAYAGDPALTELRKVGAIRFGWHPGAEAWSNKDLPYQPDLSTPQKIAAFVAKAQAASTAHVVQTGNSWFGGDADEDVVTRTPVGSHLDNAPSPPKPTAAGGTTMIVVTVDPSTLPVGTVEPGDYIFNGSSLVPIAAASGPTTDQTNLLQALGQAAPVKISFSQYQLWGGLSS